MVVFFVASMSLQVSNVYAQFDDSQKEQQESQCIDHSATHNRLKYSSIIGVPKGYISDRTLYTSSAKLTDILIDIREDWLDQKTIKSRVSGALQVSLSQLKTKSYLKSESVVILDDGLSGYFLEKELKKLKSLGFKSVKILENGIIGLEKNSQYLIESNSLFKSRIVDPQRLVGASLIQENRDNFLFVNLGKKSSVLGKLGVSSIHLPYNKYEIFYVNLKQEISARLKNNRNQNIVFVHDDPTVYRAIYKAEAAKNWPRLWFVENGSTAMQDLLIKVQLTALAKDRITYACQR